MSVYEVTGDYDIIAIGKFEDTHGMNDQIKELLSDVDIRESNTSVVLNAVSENLSSSWISTKGSVPLRTEIQL